jgi:RNA recognition motif-containing protein
MSLFVGRLSRDVRTKDLEAAFSVYGKMDRCDLKGSFAFITYANERDAEDALEKLNNKELCGSRINVEWAKKGGSSRRDRDDGYVVVVEERERERERNQLDALFSSCTAASNVVNVAILLVTVHDVEVEAEVVVVEVEVAVVVANAMTVTDIVSEIVSETEIVTEIVIVNVTKTEIVIVNVNVNVINLRNDEEAGMKVPIY